MVERNKCFQCRSFYRYYTKGVKQFNKTKLGWCVEKQDTVKSSGGCDKFVIRTRVCKVSKLVWHTLNDLLTQISELRMIIEEDKNGSDEREEV